MAEQMLQLFFKRTFKMANISNHIYFSKNQLFVNGELKHAFEKNLTFVQVFKTIYKDLNVDYPKYFKMDSLSKLGFLSAEVLLQNRLLTNEYKAERIGVMVNNTSSTILMDIKHQETLSDRNAYFPSPANFVYTLPNIMCGEICIRNNFKGENAVFISKDFDAAFLYDYTANLFANNKIDACIFGYINIDEDKFESFLMLIENRKGTNFEINKINEIYKNYKNTIHG